MRPLGERRKCRRAPFPPHGFRVSLWRGQCEGYLVCLDGDVGEFECGQLNLPEEPPSAYDNGVAGPDRAGGAPSWQLQADCMTDAVGTGLTVVEA